MKFKRLLPSMISTLFFVSVIALSLAWNTSKPVIADKTTAVSTEDSAEKVDNAEEMRGVWVTYMDLSMENESEKSEKRFTEKFDEIAKNSKDFGFNTLIVQVRPFCDALYESEYFPYSHILTGNQGENPEYDALEIMCEICREYDLKIHAWINPYRVSVSKTPSELCESNLYEQNNKLGFETESGIYLDPSSTEAQSLIIDGVEEIVSKYDVDGIQFDDYFYPNDVSDCDRDKYEAYSAQASGECMSIDEWRCANVNMLICNVYRKIHSTRSGVVFGISPQGNLDNNANLYADVKSWCICSGYVDYICPQIYFSLENPALSFESSLNAWEELEFSKNVKLYIGLAGYKAGSESDEGTWLTNDDILAKEYEIISNDSKASGFMLYSYSSLLNDDAEVEINNLKNQLN